MKNIIPSAWQIRAILENRLSMIAVPIKPQPDSRHHRIDFEQGVLKESVQIGGCWDVVNKTKPPYPLNQPVYVRETWAMEPSGAYTHKIGYSEPTTGQTGCDYLGNTIRWRSPVTMPLEASRFILTPQTIKAVRVQEITNEQWLAIGVNLVCHHDGEWDCSAYKHCLEGMTAGSCMDKVTSVWNARYAKSGLGYDTNCWCWLESVNVEGR